MRIGADEVRHVARLAELAIADGDVPLLAAQLEGIVNFVAQLNDVAIADGRSAVVVGPIATWACARTWSTRFRWCAGQPKSRRSFQQGFFVVPKLGGLAEA